MAQNRFYDGELNCKAVNKALQAYPDYCNGQAAPLPRACKLGAVSANLDMAAVGAVDGACGGGKKRRY